MKSSTVISIAGLNGFVATTIAAMGSHMLPISAADMPLFETAYLFHFVHSLALLGCAALINWGASQWGARAAIFFMIGIVCFSFSLYLRAVMGPGSLGSYHWVTPLGGLALMGGWLTVAYGGFKVSK